MIWHELLGIWLAAGFTLAIYSFLYKDNPAYKLAEHIYVGVSTGYIICIAYWEVIDKKVIAALGQHEWIVIIPTLMGLAMFARFSKKVSWLSRIPLAFIIGYTAGVAAPNNIQGLLIVHSYATINPVLTAGFAPQLNAIIMLLGVTCGMIYFFFSVERKGPIKVAARLGIFFLMIYFGVAYGYMVMGRESILIGRLNFLILDWIKPTLAAIARLFGG